MMSDDARSRIDSTNEQFMAAFERGDAAQIASFYTSDAILLPPNHPQVRGTESIRALWEGLLQRGVAGVRLETDDFTDLGESAVEVGRATVLGQGGKVVDEGKYLVVWKREGSAWKLHRDIWNSSRPAAS